jgi:hypothetical protein
MIWLLLLATIAIALVFHRRRRRPVASVLRSESLSILHGGLAKKHDAKKRAALNAASDALR